ncbi:MAG TPA: serine/threonine-protein kinase [Candidatus Acidoferrum sp.]|nr:serine/threonine-protein kinase [Candidatus Acidoferrum sp.]
MYCSQCGSEVAATAKFCSSCGSGVSASDQGATLAGMEDETFAPQSPLRTPGSPNQPRIARPTSHPSSTASSSDAIGGGRFAPGTVLEGRYRIVALAGRGGMGEVYRAEDLKLSQTVAIKFLPERLSQDAAALQRFHSEVRIARQVSHPNVCRMFDVGEIECITFLTMEFVDGEDLASLIRRIGRLPQDKAIEVARQVCAGLAAAHDKGVIHRDLKPANIMLDGQGKVRINDFGLAGIAATIQGAEVRAGTPAYMAPEQLAGSEVTIRSDIYSLGLVLYEISTGKRAFEAGTLEELIRVRNEVEILKPSSLVRDLDPLVERIILQCLDKDPAQRPASALKVAAALPGGDPLAAALAAGETPSPEMVAAAGEDIGYSRRSAIVLLGAFLVGIGLYLGAEFKGSGLDKLSLENPPEVLEKKSREIILRLGYDARPNDKASGFDYDGDLIEYVTKNDKPQPDWDKNFSHPASFFQYWYRQSPQPMLAAQFGILPGVVGENEPRITVPGMVKVRLDAGGRLLDLIAVPPQKEAAPESNAPPNWTPLFEAAQLEIEKFRTIEPEWTANVAMDARAAWVGTWPGTERALRVEAASFHGKPVFFSLIGPWSKPASVAPPQTAAQIAAKIVEVVTTLSVILFGIWLAWRNYAKGRGDLAGAWRVAAAMFVIQLLVFLFRAHLVADLDSLGVLALAVAAGLFVSSLLFVVYLALEPYVRRNWPQTIVSWTRLLDGRLRDPIVGRDILTGSVLGIFWCLVFLFGYLFKIKHGALPLLGGTSYMVGARVTLGLWLSTAVTTMLGVMNFFFLLVLLRILVRNRWLAAALFVVIFTLPKVAGSGHFWSDIVVWGLIYVIAAYAVVRFGLITLATACLVANVLLNVPITRDFSRWYAPNVYFVVLIFVAIAVWGAYTSLGERKLMKEDAFT